MNGNGYPREGFVSHATCLLPSSAGSLQGALQRSLDLELKKIAMDERIGSNVLLSIDEFVLRENAEVDEAIRLQIKRAVYAGLLINKQYLERQK